jgi:hypothetical protein
LNFTSNMTNNFQYFVKVNRFNLSFSSSSWRSLQITVKFHNPLKGGSTFWCVSMPHCAVNSLFQINAARSDSQR